MGKRLLYAVPAAKFDRIFPESVRARIAEVCDVIDAPVPERPDKEFVLNRIAKAEILITSWRTAQVDADIIAAAPDLKLVCHAAGSIKSLISDAAWKRNIRVTSAAPAIAAGVAEYCLGAILTASKRIFWLAERVRQGYWRESLDVFGPLFEIYRQNVGIISASCVGRELMRLLQPFECNILLYDPYCSAEEAQKLGVTKVATLDEIFSQCRVVSLNAPVTEETEGMIRGRHFAMLPRGAVFINTARGIIINQQEMVEELRTGKFVACLDVTYPEPPTIDHELRRLPNVLITPHVAGAVAENLMHMGELVADEVAAYAAGKPLRAEVTHDRLATMA